MNISEPLFLAKDVCFGPIDHEKDAEIEARWTNDASYLRMISQDPAIPMTAAQIKKRYEAIEKSQEEKHELIYFTIRMRQDDRLIGFAKIEWIDWSNAGAFVQMGIGDPQDRRRGYGSQALSLLLRFCFAEVNFFRLAAMIPEFNSAGLSLFKKFGFVEEVRRRQSLNYNFRRWDMIHLGLLVNEWNQNHAFQHEPLGDSPDPRHIQEKR